jgi:ABC-type sulfate transport system substrate-binding protein
MSILLVAGPKLRSRRGLLASFVSCVGLSCLSLCSLAAGCSGEAGSTTPGASAATGAASPREVELLHVSYDPTRELFEIGRAHV